MAGECPTCHTPYSAATDAYRVGYRDGRACDCTDGVRWIPDHGPDGRAGTRAVLCTLCAAGLRQLNAELDAANIRQARVIERLEARLAQLEPQPEPRGERPPGVRAAQRYRGR